jgi:hypothetical protein
MISVHIYKQDNEDIVVNGNGTEPGHIIVTSIDGRNGQAKQVVRPCLDPLIFYKNWFIAIASKNWFLQKNWVWCLETSF